MNHLVNALKGSTEIAGGIVMSQLLLLKDTDNVTVNAGMSGRSDDNVALFAGGTFEQAMEAASTLSNLLPLLLTKSGIGSNIGCLRIESSDTVSVNAPDGNNRVLIQANNGNGYCSILMQHKENDGSWKTDTELTNAVIAPPSKSSGSDVQMMHSTPEGWHGLAKAAGAAMGILNIMYVNPDAQLEKDRVTPCSVTLNGSRYACTIDKGDTIEIQCDNPFVVLGTHKNNIYSIWGWVGLKKATNGLVESMSVEAEN